MKKAISFLLALVMALSLLPAAVWAEGDSAGSENVFAYEGVEIYTQYTDNKLGYSGENLDGLSVVTNGGGGTSVQVLCEADATSMTVYLKPQTGETIRIPEDHPAFSVSKIEALGESGIYKLTTTDVTRNTPVLIFSGETKRTEIDLLFCKRGQSGGEDNPDQGDNNDCIARYDAFENSVIITELRNLNRDTIELGVEWREELREVQRVGLPIGVIGQLAKNGKSVTLYNFRGVQLHLSAAALGDIAGKLSDGSGKDKLWVVTDFARDNGSEESMASVRSFRIQLYLNDECTEVYQPGENLNYALGCTTAASNAKYAVFAVPGEENAAPVKTDISVDSRKNEWEEDGAMRSELNHTFPVTTGGFYIVAPEGFDFANMQWLWETGEPEEPDYTFEFTGGSLKNAPEGLKVLADKGYQYPVLDTDVYFTFPQELKRWTADTDGDDWDYKIYQDKDSGIVTVEVNSKNFNVDRWQEAVKNSEQGMMADGLFFNWYLGKSDNNPPRKYGFDLMGNLDMENSDLQNFSGVGQYFAESVDADQELVEDYYYTNGHRLATINRQTGDKSLLTIKQQGEIWFSLIAMDNGVNEEGTTKTATVGNAGEKFFMLVRIQPNGDYIDTLPNNNGTPAGKDRLSVEVTDDENWTAIIPTSGSVFMRLTDPNRDVRRQDSWDDKIAELTVDAPSGYELAEWTNGRNRGSALPATITNDLYQTVRLTWVKTDNSGETFAEYVDIECQNSTEWFNGLGKDENVSVTKPGKYTDDPTDKRLKENGINVEYDPSIGYFKTTVDSSKLKDASLLLKGQAVITPPDNAKYYRAIEPAGSDSPALASGEVTRSLFDREEKHPVDRPVGMALMDWDYMELPNDGLVVYFAASQMYRELVVQWLGEDDTVIGYSYIYGRNGDFVTAVDTAVVDKLDNEEVEVPTLVTDKENLQFTCDKNPQTGSEDGRKLFLQFAVSGDYGEDATIYLPYEYFNMTKEQGLALAAQGIKPTVTHYMDDACTTTKPIIDSAYTEYGVMIVTDSFSPYVIDCSAQNEDNGSSGNRYYYTGSGSSDSTITSGADQTKQAGDIVKVTVKSGAKVQTVYVDGVALSAGDYIISGGTVKLQGTYTVKLAQGSHTLRIAYSDGSAVSTTFTLKGTTAPKTGDAGIAVYAVMALGGCTGAAALAFRRKRED